MEKEFYRVMVDGNGRTFIVDDAGNKLPPETAIHISQSLSDTANEICYLYLMYRPEKDDYKIGISIEPDRRLGELNGIEPHELLHTYPMKAHGENCAAEIEIKLHKIFKAVGQHVEGEYFRLDEHDQFVFEGKFEPIDEWVNETFDLIVERDTPNRLSFIAVNACNIVLNQEVDDYPSLPDFYMIAKYMRHNYCQSDDRIFEANKICELIWHWVRVKTLKLQE